MSKHKETPILFKGHLVRAILDGSKTQTRRPIKHVDGKNWIPIGGGYGAHVVDEKALVKCPFGQPGDLLYVRETWRVNRDYDGLSPRLCRVAMNGDTHGCVDYKASPREDAVLWGGKWRPSIHMPKWASRIWLRVTDVRVERLQDIRDLESIAEGCDGTQMHDKTGLTIGPPTRDFARSWDTIYGDEQAWRANPWVWVVSFEKAEAPT